MDAGIADTLNRNAARTFAELLDVKYAHQPFDPWYHRTFSRTLMGENFTNAADRAWLVGRLAGAGFDGPADEDWENFFSHLRAEIEARRSRDTDSSSRRAAENPVGGMV
jgi:hypothetical protein